MMPKTLKKQKKNISNAVNCLFSHQENSLVKTDKKQQKIFSMHLTTKQDWAKIGSLMQGYKRMT